MVQEERGGIVRTYSSGVKMTCKARIIPMETTFAKGGVLSVRRRTIYEVYFLDTKGFFWGTF